MLERSFGGITCRDVLAYLSDYLDGDLGNDDVQRLVAHVSVCTECSQFGARFTTIVKALQAIEADDVPPARFDKLERRLRER